MVNFLQMLRQTILVFLLLFAGISQSFPSTPHELLQKANQAYISEEYATAIELYESIIAQGYEAAELYYNLGNSYFRHGNIGKAILNYERSLRIDPRNEDAMFNLRVATARTVDQITPLPLIFYKRWWKGVYNIFSLDAWAWIGVVFVIFTLVGLGVFFVSRALKTKKIALGISLFFLMTTFTSFFAARAVYFQNYIIDEAIVLVPNASVKSSPSNESPEVFVIHEGTKAKLTGELGDWYEIRLANGNVGWIQKSAIEVI
ncbi:MAG TPA: tetratricopeptide repeat protein [Bacteroidales bacterium]|nr:tetratricopeptide repeat protein [Bacteroidales bacterium]